MVMCLVRLVYLPLLSINTSDLTYNITRSAYSRTTSVSFFISSLFIILEFHIDITAVYATLYSLSELDWETGTVICVQ